MTVDVAKEWEKLGFTGLFSIECAIPREDIEWFRDCIGSAVVLPGSRQPWLVLAVEELVIGARVVLVRRDLDALFDFAGIQVGRLGG